MLEKHFSAAALLAAKGLNVVDCYGVDDRGACTCPKKSACPSPGKHPKAQNWPASATSNEDTIASWVDDTPSNIGVVWGEASGVIDVEFDSEEGAATAARIGLEGLATPTYRSSRSVHRIFKWQPGLGERAVIKAEGLEVRIGPGCQSIVPPSTHYTGKRYAWLPGLGIDEVEPMPIPEALLAMLQGQAGAPGRASHAPASDLLAEKVSEGGRHLALLRYATKMFFRLSRESLASNSTANEVLLILRSINSTQCSPPKPDEDVLNVWRSALDYVRKETAKKASELADAEVEALTEALVAKAEARAIAEEAAAELERIKEQARADRAAARERAAALVEDAKEAAREARELRRDERARADEAEAEAAREERELRREEKARADEAELRAARAEREARRASREAEKEEERAEREARRASRRAEKAEIEAEKLAAKAALEEGVRQRSEAVAANFGLEYDADSGEWFPGVWKLKIVYGDPIHYLLCAFGREIPLSSGIIQCPMLVSRAVLAATGNVLLDYAPGVWPAIWCGAKPTKKRPNGTPGLFSKLVANAETVEGQHCENRLAQLAEMLLDKFEAVSTITEPDPEECDKEPTISGTGGWVCEKDGTIALWFRWAEVWRSIKGEREIVTGEPLRLRKALCERLGIEGLHERRWHSGPARGIQYVVLDRAAIEALVAIGGGR